MKRIIPSIASANPLYLAEEIQAFPPATPLHIDIEDGNFVNNITFGMRTVRAIAAAFPQHPLCFHLMTAAPSQYFREIAACGGREVAVHFEALPYPAETLCAIRELGMKAGLALNLRTPVEQIAPFFEYLDFVMLMTAECGSGGTNGLGFCLASHERIGKMREMLPKEKELWVDGAIDEMEMERCFALGVDAVVAGRLLFPEGKTKDGTLRRISLPNEREVPSEELLRRLSEKYCR